MIDPKLIAKVPKVELHDHLDGGLRPQTVIELARENNVALPSYDAGELKEVFVRGCRQKSLSLYLETFGYTVGVMQTPQALERVAFEAVEDLAAQNVVYAEIRFAPALHLQRSLTMQEVVLAVLRGLEAGKKATGMRFGLILCAMRHSDPALSLKVAELAVAFRDRGVVAFDLAGDEKGNPPKKHLEAFQYIRNRNFNITIHAGEAFGVESIWQAIQVCGAQRIGHGTRLVDDMVEMEDGSLRFGALSQFILDKRIPLEQCISSNVGTGAAADYASHPFNIFYKNRFRVFLCSDNRLMSDTNLTHEMTIAAQNFDLGLDDLEKITLNAMKSAFVHHGERLDIIYNVIKARYAAIRAAQV